MESTLERQGYETKGYYSTEYYEQVGETYKELRQWFIDEFGFADWCNTKERNSILFGSEIHVIAQISNECGALIPYETWLKNRKEMPRKKFHEWVIAYINQEEAARKLSMY